MALRGGGGHELSVRRDGLGLPVETGRAGREEPPVKSRREESAYQVNWKSTVTRLPKMSALRLVSGYS